MNRHRIVVTFTQRRLPHIHAIGHPLFVTFRLSGSLPKGREFPEHSLTSGQAFLAMDRLLDEVRLGPCHLRNPPLATLVRVSIQHCARSDFDLHARVIMPNHVHMLVTPRTDVACFMRRLKGFTAREANKLMGAAGTRFWQDESYDHLVRTSLEFRNIERYIINIPVNAGIVSVVEAFPWSSATEAGLETRFRPGGLPHFDS